MLGKHLMDTNKEHSNTASTPDLLLSTNNKNYVNYVNFNNNRESQRQPDHVALYTLNPNPHPNPNSNSKNTNNLIINRNPYVNQPVGELRKEPPKDTFSRNMSNKQQFASRQSQELIRKTETLKSAQKSNSISSKGLSNNSLHSSVNKTNKVNEQNAQLGLTNYNNTVDLGTISRTASTMLGQDEVLKQRIEYLQFIEQCLRQFQQSQNISILKSLNEDNRLLHLKYFQEINRIKDERSRKTVSDLVSESDNLSEDNYSMDSRNTSLRIHSEKNKFSQGFSRIRDHSQEKQEELTMELRLNEKLERQYKQLMNSNSVRQKQMQKIDAQIKNIEKENAQLNIKNQQIKQKLTSLPFYQEWKLMNDEAEGARKTEVRLKQELKKRKEKLKEAKQQPNKEGTSQQWNNRKSQQTRSREKVQLQKERQGSVSKNTTMKPKMQPLPLPARPLAHTANESTPVNRIIQDSSLRIMGVSSQSRNKSVNQSSNN